MPEHYGICFAWATLLYTFQIYCDFSGYSDMAVGVARMLGFDLIQNFRQPYLAGSIKEFWGRWHISLSTWFRDYVYIPLGGNRCSKARRDLNLLITFLCSGLWHGASWTFVLWGGIHGVCQIIENRIKEAVAKKTGAGQEHNKQISKTDIMSVSSRAATGEHKTDRADEKGKMPSGTVKAVLTLITFCVVSYAWMFYRANSISEAFYIVRSMFTDLSLSGAMAQMTMSGKSVVKTTAAIVLLIIFDCFNEKKDLLKELNRLPSFVRFAVYVLAAIVVIALKVNNNYAQEFIYFKF